MKFTRTLLSLLLTIVLLGAPALAQKYRHTHRGSTSHTYTNVEGRRVRSPIRRSSVPAGASAQCRDGSYSFSQHRQGTCSHHGGMAKWL